MSKKIYIPFRLRDGADMRRGANLNVVLGWWYSHGYEPVVVSDGGSGDAQFNRHRAYNTAVAENPNEDVFVFSEADMLIHPDQIEEAKDKALTASGLVVPFTEYRYLSDKVTAHIRDCYTDLPDDELAEWWSLPVSDPFSVFDMRPESVMKDGKSIGAVNVVSRKTLYTTGGFTESTSGNWYDDNIVDEGFAFLTRRTRFVRGPAMHLYHLPGWTGDHLTPEDRAATQHNKAVLDLVRKHIQTGDKSALRRLNRFRRS